MYVVDTTTTRNVLQNKTNERNSMMKPPFVSWAASLTLYHDSPMKSWKSVAIASSIELKLACGSQDHVFPARYLNRPASIQQPMQANWYIPRNSSTNVFRYRGRITRRENHSTRIFSMPENSRSAGIINAAGTQRRDCKKCSSSSKTSRNFEKSSSHAAAPFQGVFDSAADLRDLAEENLGALDERWGRGDTRSECF
mgnify:CR=1 FL=1